MCHDLITQLSPNPKKDVGYNPQLAMAIDRVMRYINYKKMFKGESSGQQYIIQKGLNIFGIADLKQPQKR